jgi:hypothetical protein
MSTDKRSKRSGGRFSKEARAEAEARRKQARGAWPELKRSRNPRGTKKGKKPRA